MAKKYRKFTKTERAARGLDEYHARLRMVRAQREARAQELRSKVPKPSGEFSKNSRE
jgi:hypothetical protein